MATARELRQWRDRIAPRGLLAFVSSSAATAPALIDFRVPMANLMVREGYPVERIDWRELHGFEGDDG